MAHEHSTLKNVYAVSIRENLGGKRTLVRKEKQVILSVYTSRKTFERTNVDNNNYSQRKVNRTSTY